MKIIFFYRNIKSGFSIHKVFNTIVDGFKNEKDTIIKLEVPFYRASLKSIIKNLFFIYKNRLKEGVNHITGDIHYGIFPLIGCKSVLTIHDLVLLQNTINPYKKQVLFLFWYYLPVKLATEVVCISQATKEDLLKYVKRNDIKVISNPVDPMFNFIEKEFNIKKPVILHIGSGWNKNLSAVILALKGIECHLRIIGKINEKQLQLLKEYHINYSNGFKLTDLEILDEYKNCDIVSFPSIFEGFGMPIIEGQATGRVVLTSNISPMKGIGGKAVQLVNPKDVLSIREGFLKIIKDKNHRDCLIKEGIENTKKFKSEAIVKEYMEVYKQL